MKSFSIERLILERPLLFSSIYLPKSGRILENLLVGMHLAALRSSANSLPVALEELRNRKLKRLLSSAANLAFWKGKIPENILRTDNPITLMPLLPVITKAELRLTNMDARTQNSTAAIHGIFTGTSGSTGEPLQFFIDSRLGVRQWALLARLAGLNVFRPASLVHLWPTANPNPLFGHTFFHAVTPESLASQKLKIYAALSQPGMILHSPPSLLRILLEFVNKDGIALRPLRIVTSSEALLPQLSSRLKEVFQCPVISYYGSRELSVMAGGCESGRFHENSEDIIIEAVSGNGVTLKRGETGRLVMTGLNSFISPFIRYYTGDHGFLYPDLCPCGNPFTSFGFEGRMHETVAILLPNGEHIFPHNLTGIFNKRFNKILQYQVDHHAPYAFRILIVPSALYNQTDEEEIVREFVAITHGTAELRCVSSIKSQGPKVLPYIKSWF